MTFLLNEYISLEWFACQFNRRAQAISFYFSSSPKPKGAHFHVILVILFEKSEYTHKCMPILNCTNNNLNELVWHCFAVCVHAGIWFETGFIYMYIFSAVNLAFCLRFKHHFRPMEMEAFVQSAITKCFCVALFLWVLLHSNCSTI